MGFNVFCMYGQMAKSKIIISENHAYASYGTGTLSKKQHPMYTTSVLLAIAIVIELVILYFQKYTLCM